MAKGKKGSGKHYVSKGERPSVSSKTRNMVRRARREERPIEDVLKSNAHRARVIAKPVGEHERKLKQRYLEEERVAKAAVQLMKQFESKGLSWALAVQAVKTDSVAMVSEKFAKRGKKKEAKQKASK